MPVYKQNKTNYTKNKKKSLVVSFSPVADIPLCDLLLFTYPFQTDAHPTLQYHIQKAYLCIGVDVRLRTCERTLTKVLTKESTETTSLSS